MKSPASLLYGKGGQPDQALKSGAGPLQVGSGSPQTRLPASPSSSWSPSCSAAAGCWFGRGGEELTRNQSATGQAASPAWESASEPRRTEAAAMHCPADSSNCVVASGRVIGRGE